MVYSPNLRPQSSEKFRGPPESSGSGHEVKDSFDVRLNLRGKNGGGMVLEVKSGVLSANSDLFAGFIADYEKGISLSSFEGTKICRIEVPEVQNLGVFKETIELMFEDDITLRLTKIGVYRSIGILEVSCFYISSIWIMFILVISCLILYIGFSFFIAMPHFEIFAFTIMFLFVHSAILI